MLFKTLSQLKKLLLFASIILTTAGCADESVFDCIDDDGPRFVTGQISNPVLNQPYSETITVEIQNEPNDDTFRYAFQLSGNLPPGVSGNANGRRYTIEGTPNTAGTFQFTLLARVTGQRVSLDLDRILFGEADLCFTEATRSFAVTVQ